MPDRDPLDSGLSQPAAAASGALGGWRANRELDAAQRRQSEADAIAWELSSRDDLQDAPEVVVEFLFGPWAQVLAHLRMTGAADPQVPHAYEDAIGDLLSSVKPQALRQPAQALRRVPPLLATLRQGLSLLGDEAQAHEGFFEALMQLHRPVLHLRRARTRRDADSTWSGLSQPSIVSDGGPGDDEDDGFAPTLLHDRAQEPAPVAARPTGVVVGELREGDWVEMCSNDRWVRAQVVWVSGNARFFMFASEGGRRHSMTRRTCERLQRDGLLLAAAADAGPVNP